MSAQVFHLVTGEYPPQPGGVSDYTAQLACGLARSGVEVHVWGPRVDGITPDADGVIVHRSAGKWSRRDLARLDREMDLFTGPRKIIVQYAPNAWGYKGLNFQFCRWVGGRKAAGDDIRLMVHEPFYPWRLFDKPTRWLLAAGHRWMIRTLLSASTQTYVSIPQWEKLLRTYKPGSRSMTWVPIPSTIPLVRDDEKVAEIRKNIAPHGELVIGTFGTYGPMIREMLTEVLPPLLLGNQGRVGLLLGRDSKSFASEMLRSHSSLSERVIVREGLDAESVSINLQACDLLIQPYPDGVSSRRTSVMAGLAHALPIVTTVGFLSETIWSETKCIELAPTSRADLFIHAVEVLLADPERRSQLGQRASETYEKFFGLERTLEKILDSRSNNGRL